MSVLNLDSNNSTLIWQYFCCGLNTHTKDKNKTKQTNKKQFHPSTRKADPLFSSTCKLDLTDHVSRKAFVCTKLGTYLGIPSHYTFLDQPRLHLVKKVCEKLKGLANYSTNSLCFCYVHLFKTIWLVKIH